MRRLSRNTIRSGTTLVFIPPEISPTVICGDPIPETFELCAANPVRQPYSAVRMSLAASSASTRKGPGGVGRAAQDLDLEMRSRCGSTCRSGSGPPSGGSKADAAAGVGVGGLTGVGVVCAGLAGAGGVTAATGAAGASSWPPWACPQLACATAGFVSLGAGFGEAPGDPAGTGISGAGGRASICCGACCGCGTVAT